MKINDMIKRIAAAGVLVGCLALTGCGQPPTAGGPQQGGTPEVAVVVVQPQRLVITMELP